MTTAVRSPVTAYAEAVSRGAVVTNRLVRLACERHLRDLKRKDIHFDEDAAQRAIDFFGHLRLAEGQFAGQPFTLQPWQEFIVGSLLGWKITDGSRRFRVAYIEVAKGNGKTPMAAGIGLYCLTADGEQSAEVYAAAVTREQANIGFRDAKLMAEASPALARRLTIQEHNIAYEATHSFFRPVSSEHRGLDGKRPQCALIDEIHEHPSDIVVEKMRAGTKGRRQALIIEITNSGYDRRTICYRHHELSVRILEGIIENDSWFAFVAGLDTCERCRLEGAASPKDGCPDCDDWLDEKVWQKANPNVGVSIPLRYLREQVAEAVSMVSKQNIVQRLNFCMWNQSKNRWISDELWEKNEVEIDLEALRGQVCYAGLALSSTYDIAALVLWFPDQDCCLPFFWIPEESIADRVLRGVPYDAWVREGYVMATPGNVTDYDAVRTKLNELAEVYDIREVATKRWNATQVQSQLIADGFEVVQYSDGMKDMSPATKELERLLSEGNAHHDGNPVLRFHASNVAIRTDAEEHVRPDKEASPERFDGIEALIMAIGRTLTLTEEESAGVFFA